MATVPKRPLTEEEIADASRLKRAWKNYQGSHSGATQEWLGVETGLGGQSVIGQYLNGQIQLNVKALLAFCRVLEVPAESISPTLAKMIPNGGAGEKERGKLVLAHDRKQQESPRQEDLVRLINLFWSSTPAGRADILVVAGNAEKWDASGDLLFDKARPSSD